MNKLYYIYYILVVYTSFFSGAFRLGALHITGVKASLTQSVVKICLGCQPNSDVSF